MGDMMAPTTKAFDIKKSDVQLTKIPKNERISSAKVIKILNHFLYSYLGAFYEELVHPQF